MNPRLVELRKAHLAKVAEMRKLSDRAKTAKRNLTDEERAQFDSLEKECDGIEAEISREEKLEAREARLSELRNDPAYGEAVEEGDEENRSEQEEERRARAGRGGNGEQRSRSKWGSFGEFLSAVAAAEIRGRQPDPRLIQVRAASGMNESIGEQGGFLVEKLQIEGLLQRGFAQAAFASRCRRLPVGPGKNGISMLRLKDASRATGARWGGIQTYWVGESEAKTASRPEFDTLEMKLKKIAALCYVTDDLLEDAVGLEGLINELFPQEFAFAIDDALLYGTGVGQPQGVQSSPCLIVVPKQDAQVAKTIIFDNILNMLAVFFESGGADPAWFINKNCIPQLAKMSLTIGLGGVPVWMPANGAAGQRYSTLFGYPVIPVEHANTLGTQGDIMLADWKQYLIIEKGDVKKDVSIHVRFLQDETAFRFIKRIDGQPIWDQPVTPYKGAAGEKHSPFVQLAVRA